MGRKGQKAKHSRSRIQSAILKGLCFDSEGPVAFVYFSYPAGARDKGGERIEIELRAAAV